MTMSLSMHIKAGIAAARPAAERELRAYLKQFKPDADCLDTLPGFKGFAAALFDGGAAACNSETTFADLHAAERFLREELIFEVIEQMSPARGLAEAKGEYKRPANFSFEYRPDEVPVAVDAVDEDSKPLNADAHRYASLLLAPHGDIEFFLANAGLIPKLSPDVLEKFQTAIRAHLETRIFWWAARMTANVHGQPLPSVVQEDAGPVGRAGLTSELAANSGLTVDLLYFQYRYAEDFPAGDQNEIEDLRLKANRRFVATAITSYDELSAAKSCWLLELSSGAARVFGRVGVMLAWNPNQRRDAFWGYVAEAADAARLTQPALRTFYDSPEWKSLDGSLFPDLHSAAIDVQIGVGDETSSAGSPPSDLTSSSQETCSDEQPDDLSARMYNRIGTDDRARGEQQRATTDILPETAAERFFRKEGDAWIISFESKAVHVRHSKGMAYICQLLQKPGESLHSFQLVSAAAGCSGSIRLGSAGRVIDEKALKEYRDRMDDIETRLSQAERDWDQAQKESLMAEQEHLEEQIHSAVGFRGEVREASDDEERARKSVSNAISRAITSIRAHHPTAADHFQRRVSCGVFVCYAPDDVPWEF
jgi:hypothetical protein